MGTEDIFKILPYIFQGLTAYIGVRVALAEIRAEQKAMAREITRLDERITFLERSTPHFQRKG